MFHRVLAIPFAIIAGISLYYGFDGSKSYFTFGLTPSVIILATIYIFSKEIDFWYQKKFPIKFDKNERELAEKYSPFYMALNEEQKLRFQQRMHLFLSSKDFTAMGMEAETVPHDLKFVTGLITIEMTFYKEDNYRLDQFDHIVFYKHPFPTPSMQYLHTVETNAEDGVIIIAMDYFSAAIGDMTRFYHTGYHVIGEAFAYVFKKENYPLNVQWETIEKSTGFTRDQIIGVLGLKQIDLLPILISTYFAHAEKLKEVDPQIHSEMEDIFRRREIS